MKRVAFAAAFVLALTACRREEAPPAAAAPPPPNSVAAVLNAGPPDDAEERKNLLNIAKGASVVSRTGEDTLDNSAVQAIDGNPVSAWLSPIHDVEQTFVFSLAARSRIDHVGAKRTAAERTGMRSLVFERSLDGRTFAPLATIQLAAKGDDQLFPVEPTDALYLRVTVREPTGVFGQLSSIHARGTELEPPREKTIAGCWSINGMTAAFTQHGASAYGRVADRRGDIALDGGSDGRTFRFVWTRGPQYGMALVTLSADAQHLSGLKWHEEALPDFLSESWFGDRVPCTNAQPPENRGDVIVPFLRDQAHFPLYALRFDDAGNPTGDSAPLLDALARLLASTKDKSFRFAGHANPKQLAGVRAALAQRGVDVARIAFEQAPKPRRDPFTDFMRAMYGAMELEVRR